MVVPGGPGIAIARVGTVSPQDQSAPAPPAAAARSPMASRDNKQQQARRRRPSRQSDRPSTSAIHRCFLAESLKLDNGAGRRNAAQNALGETMALHASPPNRSANVERAGIDPGANQGPISYTFGRQRSADLSPSNISTFSVRTDQTKTRRTARAAHPALLPGRTPSNRSAPIARGLR